MILTKEYITNLRAIEKSGGPLGVDLVYNLLDTIESLESQLVANEEAASKKWREGVRMLLADKDVLRRQLTLAKAQVAAAYRDAAKLAHTLAAVCCEDDGPDVSELGDKILARTDKDAAAALERIVAEKMKCGHPKACRVAAGPSIAEPAYCSVCVELTDKVALEVDAALRGAADHRPIYNQFDDPVSCVAPGCQWQRRGDHPRDEWVSHILALIPTGGHLKRHDARLLEPMEKLVEKWRNKKVEHTEVNADYWDGIVGAYLQCAHQLMATLQQARGNNE